MKSLINLKNSFSTVFLVCALTTLSGCGSGGSSRSSTPIPITEDLPSQGIAIINSDNPQMNGGTIGTITKINTDGPGFTESFKIEVLKPTGLYYQGQLAFDTTQYVAKNDVLLIHTWIRKVSSADESGSAFLTVFLEINKAPHTKFVFQEISSNGEWQEYFIPVQIPQAAEAGSVGLKFGFGAGSKTQTLEIGGVELLNYGSSKTLAELPLTLDSYAGRELDAPWRAEANARIEKIRKGDFKVKITDADDKEVTNALIDIKFKKHDYHFGSVIDSHILMGNSADSQMYRDKVLELFNQSGTVNDLKWGPWIGEWGNQYSKEQTLSALNWLKEQGLYLRGHVMVWPSRKHSPNFIKQFMSADQPGEVDPVVEQLILDHIDDIGAATQNVLDEWDVLNEPYDNHDYMDAFGRSVMSDWFNRARINLPTQKLFINDYAILSAGGRNTAHQDFYAETIQYLIDQGAPVDGIGMQSHFGRTPTAIHLIYSILNRFSEQFPDQVIRSTEFDVNTTDEQLQADYTRDFMTIFFSHPATVGIQMWGFWSKAHWKPDAAFYDDNWREKPNAVAWKNLTKKVWWNDFSGTTNESGEYSNRGFYGIYTVNVTANGDTQAFQIHVEKDKINSFTLKLKN